MPQKQLRAQAQLVFNAVALRGPNYRGVLLSPARFRVRHYGKGSGPRFVRVTTATRKIGRDSYVTVGEGIAPRAGELWRIYGSRGKNGVVQTSFCSGSARLAH